MLYHCHFISIIHKAFISQIIFSFSIFLSLSAWAMEKDDDLVNLHEQIRKGQAVYAVGFNLQGANLQGLKFKDANFSRANLKGVNFSEANLSRAIFSYAEMPKADFSRAKLKWADFTDANINGAIFKGASLLCIEYHSVRSAKGTLFEDRREILNKLIEEQRVYNIKKNFLQVMLLLFLLRKFQLCKLFIHICRKN
ncbi:pentapeptide repeat-containing protein [Candidatus Paracaedibacter symbiosus]|uniref:pentapeptide repeat-containing protein n=1 Tax=Candidatus Paracaedibacter symbiosus TaxID=244582 RepID=UPI00068FE055|nr:pentapeptide repeat-containing protein [Candidatus Paracaedibacter symbiosus]